MSVGELTVALSGQRAGTSDFLKFLFPGRVDDRSATDRRRIVRATIASVNTSITSNFHYRSRNLTLERCGGSI